jgi:hypothetical protein
MKHVAFTTFAVMKDHYGTEVTRGFEERTPAVFAAAERSEGFVARAKELDDRADLTNGQRDWGAWGPFHTPRFYTGGHTMETDTRASTLSLWRDLASVRRFAYAGLHREALRRRKEWFVSPEWPSYAVWWVGAQHIPTWREASERLEYLHDHGCTPAAFNFRRPFDEHGNVIELLPTAKAAS